MKIHVVKKGETIYSIAELYGVPAERIILENGFAVEGELVPGQNVIITYPQKTYIVQNGDTIQKIADSNGITVLELIRNNPYLLDRQYIYPGETLIISYGNRIRKITTNGYAREFIDRDVLRKTLPYLTYLSILGYRVIEDDKIEEIDDTEILQMTKRFGVAPLLIITTLSTLGQINVENAYTILNNENKMDILIDNLIDILKRKGYYGINITYELLTDLTLPAYETFNTKAYKRCKKEGLAFFVTISPHIVFTANEITFEKIDYSKIVQQSDRTIVLNYLWGSYMGPPGPIASVLRINEFLDYLIPQVFPDKLAIGLPLIAYDWELPYSIGLSKAVSLTLEMAIFLAQQFNAIIQFDEQSQTPFFTYNTALAGIPINHIVWSVNPTSMDAVLKIITDRGLNGSGLWNVMTYDPQIWLVINTQYEIDNIFGA